MKIPIVLLLLLVVSSLLVTPVKAHFTLGDLTPVPRFHANDFEPHVAGPTAYVWPGGGFSSYVGLGNDFPPGYQSPYPGGNPPGQSKAAYQVEGDSYAPFGAVLVSTPDHSSRGPLIFALNFSQPCQFGWNDVDNSCGSGVRYSENFTGLIIYVPPEFDLSALFSGRYSYNPGLVESTFGATADDITITQASSTDPWGPGWWVVSILGDIHWWPQHDYREWYYLRINDVVAPQVAGRYFFKIFLQDEFFNFVYPGMPRSSQLTGGECGVCNQGTITQPNLAIVPYAGPTNATVPVENWPVLLVKGDVDPAIITGTIRYGTFNSSLYGKPINFSGRVRAKGTAINPYDTNSLTGRSIEARGYFNATAQGHYEVEGLAPEIYDVYASAAGYPEQQIATNVIVLPTQSLHLDGYVDPGIIVQGVVKSKDKYGTVAWPNAPRSILIEIYRSNDYAASSLAAFSPLNLTHQPFMAYDWDYFSPHPNLPTPHPVAFPWFTSTLSYYTEPFLAPPGNPNYNSHLQINCGGNVDSCGKQNGIGPAQYWWVDSAGEFTNGGGTDGFVFQFGAKGIYGAPAGFDGHIPQSFASWVNGLEAGHYWLRAWVNGYTQTGLDGTTINQSSFEVSKREWAGDVYVPLDLRVSGTISVTTHFHDQKNTLMECPIDGCAGNLASGLSKGDRYLIAELRDDAGKLFGINFTEVNSDQSSANIEINGFGMIGPDVDGIKYSYMIYQGYRDYGIPTGTYHINFYMRGYLQSDPLIASVTNGYVLENSANLHRGARMNMTLYSLDWERPRIQNPWEFPGARLRIYITNSETQLSEGYIGYPSLFAAIGGDRTDEPIMQPTCYTKSTTPPFCPTGSTQVISPDDPMGSTIVINEWDGVPYAEVDGAGIYPTVLFFGQIYFPPWNLGGFLVSPSDYRFDVANNYAASDALQTAMYSAYAFTYGYVQTTNCTVSSVEGGISDLRMNLLQGINITLYIPMTTEGLITPTQFNMSMRVRIFDNNGNLLATATTRGPDSATLRNDYDSSSYFGLGRFTGSNLYPVSSIYESYYPDPFAPSPSPGNNPQHTSALNSVNEKQSADTFLWYGSWQVGQGDTIVRGWQAFDSDPDHDGVSDFGSFQINSNYHGLSEWRTTIPYHTEMVRVFLAGIYDTFGDPLDGQNSGTISSPAWVNGTGEEIDSMHYGIYPSLPAEKTYTVEVDCWNEYPTPIFPNGMAPPPTNWYPPVEGLLEGDSFNSILSSSQLPFGLTGNSLSANGLGPYAQEQPWTLPNAPAGGSISAIFKLDKRGYIQGSILGFTIDNSLRPVSWATLWVQSERYSLTQYSWDGYYEMYLDPGHYSVVVSLEANATASQGYIAVNSSVYVSPGEASHGLNFDLEENTLPISDFKYFPFLTPSACLARRFAEYLS